MIKELLLSINDCKSWLIVLYLLHSRWEAGQKDERQYRSVIM